MTASGIDWPSLRPLILAAGPTAATAFLASLVEFVEALTVVLAVGLVRGWRPALAGSGAGLALLAGLTLLFGPLLTEIPLDAVRLGIGALLLLFGMRWLRKAVLRAAGIMAPHDEEIVFEAETASLRAGRNAGEWAGFATAAQIVLIEGLEVVFLVLALGAGGRGIGAPAAGAGAALVAVVVAGLVVHRPLSRVPENALKFAVGVMATSFGVFWIGEATGLRWPGGDWALPVLMAGFALTGAVAAVLARGAASAAPGMRA